MTFEQVIEDCLSRYQPSEVCISFNGGKDCSALLHLVHAAWVKLNQRQSTPAPMPRLRALYIRSQDPFPEMEHFIEETRQRYYRLEIEFILYFFFFDFIAFFFLLGGYQDFLSFIFLSWMLFVTLPAIGRIGGRWETRGGG